MTRSYIIVTGTLFAALAVLHIAPLVRGGPMPDAVELLVTVMGPALLATWAAAAWRASRAQPA